MMKKQALKLEVKLGLYFTGMTVLISALLTFGFYAITVKSLRDGLRQRLQDAVAIGATQLDGDALASLTDPVQEGSPTFLQLQKELQGIRDAGSGYRFVYTLRHSPDGKIRFVVDAEETPEDMSHLGEYYDDAGPSIVAHIDTLDQPVLEDEFYTDKWGTWLTGYAPVFGSDGQPKVVLGMDIAASTVLQKERVFLWTALAVFGVTLPLSLVIGGMLGRRLAEPIAALTRGAERISGGDLDYVVEVRSKDETGELAGAFNTMTKKLVHSLEALHKSEEKLTQHRDNLEIIVQERTARLTAANERMNRDLKAAARVQKTFLPQQYPDLPGLHFAWNFTPCDELAGDMLDIFKIGPAHVGVWVADVCGHGVAAALVSVTLSRLLSTICGPGAALVRQSAETADYRTTPPQDVASFLNEHFPWDPEAMRYFTFLYGILDMESNEFRYVSAGHPGPLLISGDGNARFLAMSPPAIGILPGSSFIEHQVELGNGDRLYLYTDGIIETASKDGEEFGEKRLAQFLSEHRSTPLNESVENLMEHLAIWRGGEQPDDDLSMVAVELD